MQGSMKMIDDKDLKKIAVRMRMGILQMTKEAGSGHPGPSFSIVEILAYLYFREMNLNPNNPNDPDRDRFVLSKGHAAPALYAALFEKGIISREDMLSLRKIGSMVQGHPSSKMIGVDATTGSLGLGLSQAVGMAIGAKMMDSDVRVFALVGDGECDEGQIWEAALSAGHHKLDNLVVFIDYNKDQYEGQICEVLTLEPLVEKWKSFGWNAAEIDGHDFASITAFMKTIDNGLNKPNIAISNTYKGFGVSFMKGNKAYHGRSLNNEEFVKAMAELEKDA